MTTEEQIHALTAKVAALRDLLEEIQWAAGTDETERCPGCTAIKSNGHYGGCALAAAIKGNTGQEYMSPADLAASCARCASEMNGIA